MAKLVRLRGSAPTGNRDSEDSVGYCTPPQHSRFRPGHSGNPAGRKKGVRNLKTDVKRMLSVPVKVNESGRSRKISTQAGMLMVLREKVLKGDARALNRLVELAVRFNNEPGSEVAPSLSDDDQAILAAYEEEIRGSSTSTEPLRPAGLVRRPLTRKE